MFSLNLKSMKKKITAIIMLVMFITITVNNNVSATTDPSQTRDLYELYKNGVRVDVWCAGVGQMCLPDVIILP